MKNINLIKNEIISASAGSGKTFQLAIRYITLLASGISPEKIIALTFSRKAAGEIFNKIIQRLTEWLLDAEKKKRQTNEAGLEHLTRKNISDILHSILINQHKIKIGTLDSFYISIIKNFPFEFNINCNFEIIEDYYQEQEKQKILKKILSSTISEKDKSHFIEEFKKTTFGKEENNPNDLLNDFIDNYHYLFLSASDGKYWGNKKYIWNNKTDSIINKTYDILGDTEKLRGHFAKKNLSEEQQLNLTKFLDEIKDCSPTSPLTLDASKILEKLIDIQPDLEQGNAILILNRKTINFIPEECQLLLNIIYYVVKCNLEANLIRTNGLYKILSIYEKKYSNLIRQNGQLNFNDIPYLLTNNESSGNFYSLSSNLSTDKTNKLYIDYRLDSHFDHWLLDEFQDTSFEQWQVISNLIDEIMQDETKQRGFFYVGDVKQAIYGWRGGNSKLFDYVYHKYKTSFDEPRKLVDSYRSNKIIIDFTNLVFSNINKASGLPHEIINRWQENWTTHNSKDNSTNGYVAYFLIPQTDKTDETKNNKNNNQHIIFEILQKIQPIKKRLTVGILANKNKTCREIANFLQDKGIPTSLEGTFSLSDNLIVRLFLSLIRFAALPGDNLAWEHLQMSPLAKYININYDSKSMLSIEILKDIYSSGYASLIEKWHSTTSKTITLSAFDNTRIEQLIIVAKKLDATNIKDPIFFVDYIETYKIPAPNNPNTIQVCTVHQSKGLEYDVVILPELIGISSINKPSVDSLQIKKDEQNNIDWTLIFPKRNIASLDSTLKNFIKDIDADYCYERLCWLYVAITRAKKAIYLIANEQSSNSKSYHLSTLLREILPQKNLEQKGTKNAVQICYEHGNSGWFNTCPSQTQDLIEQTHNQLINKNLICIQNPDYTTIKPSQINKNNMLISDLLQKDKQESCDLGSAVHSLFEQIEWLDNIKIDQIISDWKTQSHFPADITDLAIKMFTSSINDPSIANLFKKSSENSEAWREKKINVLYDDKLITGTLDRVNIIKDQQNTIKEVILIDFKTNKIISKNFNSLIETYKPQINLYHKALTKLLNIPPGLITKRLVFITENKIVDL